MQLKIRHKGIILLGIPLISTIAFVLLLTTQLVSIDREIQSEDNSKDILAMSHNLVRHLMNTWACAAALMVSQTPVMTQKMGHWSKLAKDDLAELRTLSQNREEERPLLDDIGASLEEADKVMGENDDRPVRKENLLAVFTDPRTAATERAIKHTNGAVAKLVVLEHERDMQNLKRLESSRVAISNAICGGLLVSIALSLGLSIYFMRSVSRRIGRVGENAQRLARRQTLNSRISGADEIAELDVALRKVDQELSKNEAARQRLVAFVSHELKSPLTAIQGIYSLITTPSYATLSAEDARLAAEAERSLEDVTALITDLIDLERMHGNKFDLIKSDTDVTYLIETVVEESAPELKERLRIAAGSEIVLMADKLRISRVLACLLRNSARRTSDHRSAIEIAASETPDNFALITVSDTGRYLSPQELRLLMGDTVAVSDEEMMAYLTEGVPLLVARLILERHDGRFEVHSSQDKTTFSFYLPIGEEFADDAA